MGRRIQDMVVVITGASAGIGKAIAAELSSRGARLALAARRVEKLEQLNAALGTRHLVVPCDVADPAQCARLVNFAHQHFGRIDTLICNAGYGMVRQVSQTTPDEMRSICSTNVFGTTDCIHAAVPLMKLQELRSGFRGQIVIVSSAAARRGLPYFGAYSATKAAQLSLAEALRVECRPLGIAVTSVHPIGTETDFFEVAQKQGGQSIPPSKRGSRQSVKVVARAIVRGISAPRAEVWPSPLARWLLSVATLFPGAVDRIMEKYRVEIEREQDR